MATHRFELLGIQDLSKEQKAACALPKEGQHLIIGGPGTGKSVLALLRARLHHQERDDYRFLVFNHLLDQASGQLFGGNLDSRTWDNWFRKVFKELAGQPVPVREPIERGYRAIDWTGVDTIVQGLPGGEGKTPPRPFLVIDEGQDMPPQFYRALVNLGFDRFFVVADQNQQIRDANSSRQELQDCLDLDTHDVIELRHNYRNHYRVARLAREFYTGDPASPPPELPAQASGAVPILYYYEQDRLDEVARGILRLADRDPSTLIGVIAPNNLVRERYVDALRTVEVRIDHPRPSVETYYHGQHRPEVAFDEGGILVINAQACKGLEFDTVVLADIDEHYFRRGGPDVAKRLFYVMVARARERVFMFMRHGGRKEKEIEGILPTDRDVLERRNLLPHDWDGHGAVPLQASTGLGQARERLQETSDEDKLHAKLRSYLELPHDWDGHGAVPPSLDAVSDTITFLGKRPSDVPLPFPQIASDGEVGLYWRTGKIHVEIGFYGDGELSYYARYTPTSGKSDECGRDGCDPGARNWPQDLVSILNKL